MLSQLILKRALNITEPVSNFIMRCILNRHINFASRQANLIHSSEGAYEETFASFRGLIAFSVFCILNQDEVCGVYFEQQHDRRPLSGVREPERPSTPGVNFGTSQPSHRLPHVCGVPGCGWCMQIYFGEIINCWLETCQSCQNG